MLHQTGQIERIEEYTNGLKNGAAVHWYASGTPKIFERFVNSVNVGYRYEFAANGAIDKIHDFTSGYQGVCIIKPNIDIMLIVGEYEKKANSIINVLK